MCSSIIEYSLTTTCTTPTLDGRFIASQAAPVNSSSSDHSQPLAFMVLNMLQAIISIILVDTQLFLLIVMHRTQEY